MRKLVKDVIEWQEPIAKLEHTQRSNEKFVGSSHVTINIRKKDIGVSTAKKNSSLSELIDHRMRFPNTNRMIEA